MKLYVYLENQFQELDTILKDDQYKPVLKIKLTEAIDKYLSIISSQKAAKNIKNERSYLSVLQKTIKGY